MLIRELLFGLSLVAGAPAASNGALPRQADLGFRVEDAGRALKVRSVDAGSPAAQAGLKVGDRIESIDGRRFDGLCTAIDYVGEKQNRNNWRPCCSKSLSSIGKDRKRSSLKNVSAMFVR